MPKSSPEFKRWHRNNINSHDLSWRKKVSILAKQRPVTWGDKISVAKTGKPCNHTKAHRKWSSQWLDRIRPMATAARGEFRPEHSKKISGSGNGRWLGGISFYRGEDWDDQKAMCLERDGYKCQRNASNHHPILDVHHIVPWRISHNNDLNNLKTLCKSCHQKTEAEYQKTEREAVCR